MAGADLSVDVPVKWLSFFMEDDAALEHIRTEYGAGRMLTGDVKAELIKVCLLCVSLPVRQPAFA